MVFRDLLSPQTTCWRVPVFNLPPSWPILRQDSLCLRDLFLGIWQGEEKSEASKSKSFWKVPNRPARSISMEKPGASSCFRKKNVPLLLPKLKRAHFRYVAIQPYGHSAGHQPPAFSKVRKQLRLDLATSKELRGSKWITETPELAGPGCCGYCLKR